MPLLEGRNNENWINHEGYFSIAMSLNYLLPLFETYNMPIVYVSQKLEYLRSLNDSICFYIKDDGLKTKLSDNKLTVWKNLDYFSYWTSLK